MLIIKNTMCEAENHGVNNHKNKPENKKQQTFNDGDVPLFVNIMLLHTPCRPYLHIAP